MNLWPNHVRYDEIMEGKTYYFENLMTGLNPFSKPFQLASRNKFKATEVPALIAARFDHIAQCEISLQIFRSQKTC